MHCTLKLRLRPQARGRASTQLRVEKCPRTPSALRTDYATREKSTAAQWPSQMTGCALRSLAAVGAAAALALSSPTLCDAATPYEEAQRLVYGPTAGGSIRGCPTNVNPNCVSTASINDSYSPVWRANESSLEAAAEVLEQGLQAALPEAQLVRVIHLPKGEYRAFTVDSMFGKDVVEFVLKPDSVMDRNWEGDKPGVLVTYRSMAGSVKYIWPIQQPVTDFGVQRKRMTAIREELGWPLIGCELLECYQ